MNLDLEKDLLLSEEDRAFMKRSRCEDNRGLDLEIYLDFLEEIGAFSSPKPAGKAFAHDFEL